MYYVKPLIADDIHYVESIMSETSNITALHSTYHSLSEWKCIFDENARDADEENFLICADNDVCAWLKLNGLQNNDIAWISMLVVSDKFKHQGVGQYAIEFAISYLKQRGYKQIKLQTTEDNLPAMKLYTKCGFAVINKSSEKITMFKKV